MKNLYYLLHNVPLMSAFIAWLVAQLFKFIIDILRYRQFNFNKFFSSGGMPSSHSAFVCALTTGIALQDGISSSAFAISCVLSMIVMYDATGVRRETGKQATILNNLVDDLLEEKPDYFQKELKELVGHTPLQVFSGAFLGIIIPFIINMYL